MGKKLFGKGGVLDKTFKDLDPVKHHPITHEKIPLSWGKSNDSAKLIKFYEAWNGLKQPVHINIATAPSNVNMAVTPTAEENKNTTTTSEGANQSSTVSTVQLTTQLGNVNLTPAPETTIGSEGANQSSIISNINIQGQEQTNLTLKPDSASSVTSDDTQNSVNTNNNSQKTETEITKIDNKEPQQEQLDFENEQIALGIASQISEESPTLTPLPMQQNTTPTISQEDTDPILTPSYTEEDAFISMAIGTEESPTPTPLPVQQNTAPTVSQENINELLTQGYTEEEVAKLLGWEIITE